MNKMNDNKQSAENAYKELETLRESTAKANAEVEELKEKLKAVESGSKEAVYLQQIDEYKTQLNTKDEQIKVLQELNQKLQLNTYRPVDEKPRMSEEEVANQKELDEINERIKQFNADREKESERK